MVSNPRRDRRGATPFHLRTDATNCAAISRAPNLPYLPLANGHTPPCKCWRSRISKAARQRTTTAHLAHYLALQGSRAGDRPRPAGLAIRSVWLPARIDVEANRTLYGAIRYDESSGPLADVIRQTYFAGLDIVPGNLELMEFVHETPRVFAGAVSRSRRHVLRPCRGRAFDGR